LAVTGGTRSRDDRFSRLPALRARKLTRRGGSRFVFNAQTSFLREFWSKEAAMGDHVYKLIELTGSSTTSIDDAIRNAIRRASKTLHNLHWFEVIETRGHIADGEVAHFQVTLKVGFTLDE
jgi:flavin-binding protein dodecin